MGVDEQNVEEKLQADFIFYLQHMKWCYHKAPEGIKKKAEAWLRCLIVRMPKELSQLKLRNLHISTVLLEMLFGELRGIYAETQPPMQDEPLPDHPSYLLSQDVSAQPTADHHEDNSHCLLEGAGHQGAFTDPVIVEALQRIEEHVNQDFNRKLLCMREELGLKLQKAEMENRRARSDLAAIMEAKERLQHNLNVYAAEKEYKLSGKLNQLKNEREYICAAIEKENRKLRNVQRKIQETNASRRNHYKH